MIIDITLLLDLADYRAAASCTGNQTGKCEVVRHATALLGETAVHHSLDPRPKLKRDQRLVLALIGLSVPFELACIEPVA
jgi:hypothetical protein